MAARGASTASLGRKLSHIRPLWAQELSLPLACSAARAPAVPKRVFCAFLSLAGSPFLAGSVAVALPDFV